MHVFDKILLIVSSISLMFLLFLFWTNIVTSSDKILVIEKNIASIIDYKIVTEKEFQDNNSSRDTNQILNTSINLKDKKNIDSIEATRDEEINKILNDYFKGIQVNPEEEEEVERLIEFGDLQEVEAVEKENSISISKKTKSKKVLYKVHIVQKGDSIWRLSKTYKIPVYSILSANPKIQKNIINLGQKIEIPFSTGIKYRVKNNDNLWDISKKYQISSRSITEVNSLSSTKIYIGQHLFLPGAKFLKPKSKKKKKFQLYWPLYGKITSNYGSRIHPISKKRHIHTGIDISAPRGSAVHAAASGVVIFLGYRKGYGNMLILRHKSDYYTIYAHLLKYYKKKGQYVSLGVKIASVGNTGNTTGYHLHFELKKGDQTINPRTALISQSIQRRQLAFNSR